jgi:hypothetical protein
VSARFETRSLHHVEPLLNFRVLHADNAHLHTLETRHPLSDHPLKVGNAANSIGAHSLKMRLRNGHKQPFPDTISLGFRAFDREFYFPELQLDAHVFAPHMQHEVTDESGKTTFHPPLLNTYRAEFSAMAASGDTPEDPATSGWIVATLAEDGMLTAVIHTNKETYQVDPLPVHEAELQHFTPEGPQRNLLRKAAMHNMVLFRHSDAKHLGFDPVTGKAGTTCATVRPRGPVRAGGNFSAVETLEGRDLSKEEQHSISPLSESGGGKPHVPVLGPFADEAVASARRRLLADPGVGVTRWTNCYTGDTTAHKMSHGVAVDYGYFAIYGSLANVQNAMANTYAAVNAVFQG